LLPVDRVLLAGYVPTMCQRDLSLFALQPAIRDKICSMKITTGCVHPLRLGSIANQQPATGRVHSETAERNVAKGYGRVTPVITIELHRVGMLT
jgi:hypothetical protein